MGNVKSFKEFVNEKWSNEPESHYRLRDLYNNDQSFRRAVDNGTLGIEPRSRGGVAPKDNETFYGLLNISKNWNPNSKDIRVSMHCLTDSPKELYGSVDSDELTKVMDDFEHEVGEEEFKSSWTTDHTIFAKVSIKRHPVDKNRFNISHLIKVYRNEQECEDDMIETLKKSEN